MTRPDDLFSLDDLPSELAPLFEGVDGAWDLLARLDAFVAGVYDDRRGEIHPTAVVTGAVHLAPGASIGPHACVEGPAWIGEGATVAHGAYLRGGVVLAPGARAGHAVEIKRSLLLRGAKAAHFNYVGDSVLGADVNLGAGVKIANLHAFGSDVRLPGGGALRKAGAILGDGVSVGCNAVLAPGTEIGRRSVVYAGALVRGRIEAETVVKARSEPDLAPRRS